MRAMNDLEIRLEAIDTERDAILLHYASDDPLSWADTTENQRNRCRALSRIARDRMARDR